MSVKGSVTFSSLFRSSRRWIGAATYDGLQPHGVPGRIQVTEAFRDLTADAFAFEERGLSDIKGIGETRTYFLAGQCGSDC